jgi:hypothetical protein
VPLRPTLLETLRMYYRWMPPQAWLFPGTVANWRADKPVTPKVLWEACVVAGQRAGLGTRHLQGVANPLDAMTLASPDTAYKSRRFTNGDAATL